METFTWSMRLYFYGKQTISTLQKSFPTRTEHRVELGHFVKLLYLELVPSKMKKLARWLIIFSRGRFQVKYRLIYVEVHLFETVAELSSDGGEAFWTT